jgi:hypothetical protein
MHGTLNELRSLVCCGVACGGNEGKGSKGGGRGFCHPQPTQAGRRIPALLAIFRQIGRWQVRRAWVTVLFCFVLAACFHLELVKSSLSRQLKAVVVAQLELPTIFTVNEAADCPLGGNRPPAPPPEPRSSPRESRAGAMSPRRGDSERRWSHLTYVCDHVPFKKKKKKNN